MMRRNAKKCGNWQPSWILAAILKFFIWQLDTRTRIVP